MTKSRQALVLLSVGSVFSGILLLAAKPGRPSGRGADPTPTTDLVIRYLRDRFGVSDSVKLTADPLHDSVSPDFYEAGVTMDDGNPQHKKTQNMYVTKDGRYLATGSVFVVGANSTRCPRARD